MKNDETWAVVARFSLLGSFAALLIGGVWGYVLNLIAIAHWADPMGILVLRCIGALIAPLGAILGWAL